MSIYLTTHFAFHNACMSSEVFKRICLSTHWTLTSFIHSLCLLIIISTTAFTDLGLWWLYKALTLTSDIVKAV